MARSRRNGIGHPPDPEHPGLRPDGLVRNPEDFAWDGDVQEDGLVMVFLVLFEEFFRFLLHGDRYVRRLHK